MGNFSRDPDDRLADALGKHQVGVRLQQGVPMLDADWNALDDIRRSELEDAGRSFLGNGVPFGNDGFRIVPIAGGGVGTIVLTSKTTSTGPSSLAIDLASSTAAASLGFGPTNASASRLGSSPASLTGNATEPFTLAAGMTLAVGADGQTTESVVFQSADFANIGAASASEVAAAIGAGLSRASATVGTGNDFVIRGGDGTTAGAGRIYVDGRMGLNESDLKYSEQALFSNTALATSWGVSPVAALASSNDPNTVFLDMWHREVDSEEDAALIDTRIGVETATRLRREWAVRVAPSATFEATVAARPAGHSYYALAEITRAGTGALIDAAAIRDLRDLDLALRTGVAFRDLSAAIVVDTDAFRALLDDVSRVYQDFAAFLSTEFVAPSSAYTAGETAGLQSLGTVANIAEDGLALLGARALDTRAALSLMDRMQKAEARVVAIFRVGVLPLLKAGNPIYQTAYGTAFDNIDALVSGPPPPGFLSLSSAVQSGSLIEALRTQQRINLQFSAQTPHATGNLMLTCLGSLTTTITKNVPFDVRYRVSGSVTPNDQIDAQVTLGAGWSSTLKNGDGSTPFQMDLGPGAASKEFVITVTPPNIDGAETDMSVTVSARSNPGGLSHFALPKHLRVGDGPPPSDESFAFSISTTNVPLVGAEFRVPISPPTTANITLRLANNTDNDINVDLTPTPATSATWAIGQGPFLLTAQPVPAHGHTEFLWHFKPTPATAGKTLSFTLSARNSATTAPVAQTTLKLVSTA